MKIRFGDRGSVNLGFQHFPEHGRSPLFARRMNIRVLDVTTLSILVLSYDPVKGSFHPIHRTRDGVEQLDFFA
jgi:hypothetical protein